ncbi:hypothetical protein QR680_004030 [Steinernema hermaphroditum]|uniref:Uncharacterized protein n=1 Tax=Steinernema hermaphroditum TaxID=289476 RepID=A0AA39HPN0_9BILA|nr:hypothetical protein QR680_004030 [Steinernema hermaphroditum]
MTQFLMLVVWLLSILKYINFSLSALLLYLSVRVVPPSLSRAYCLNLGVPTFFYTFCYVTAEHIRHPSTFQTVILYLACFGQEFILYGYVYFSNLTIFLAYITYAKPVFFRKLASKRAMILMTVLGHLFAFSSVLIIPSLVKLFVTTESKVFAMVLAAQLAFLFIIYVAMVILYVLAISKIRKNIALTGATSSIVLSHRKMLKSVLIYCTPPNILAIMAFPTCLLTTWREIRTVWHVDISSSQWSEVILNVREVVTPLGPGYSETVIAWHPILS